ncbi:oligopeptidase B [Enterobacterales bacterium CwR94]|nr:oligopeptidase B [Enterobacterales bacterium CwR94]
MITPPKATRRPHIMEWHGDRRTDDYHWLRDDKRQNAEILAYLQEENQYCDSVMDTQSALKEQLLSELIARIPQQDHSVPFVKRGWRYQSRFETGNEYPVYWRQPATANESDAWTLLLDGNARAEGHEFYTLGAMVVSPDNQRMAVAEDFLSRRIYTLRFRDLATDTWLDDVLENVSSSAVWSSDSQTIWYVLKDEQTLLPWQVWRHQLGTPQSADVLVYEEQDEAFYLGLYKTTSERYIGISLNSTTTSEVRLLDADNPCAEPLCFVARRQDHEYGVDHYQDTFWIRSNREGKNFGLYVTQQAQEESWQTKLAPRADVVLEDFALFRDWLVVEERAKGLTNLRQIHHQTGKEVDIRFDDPTYTTWIGQNADPQTSKLRYGYSSMTTPDSVLEVDMDTGERRVLKQREIAGFDAQHYVSERLWIPMRDGVEVPVSLVYHKDHYRAGKNPLLVYGYGSYGSSMDPSFSSSRLSLLDRGFVFALTHIRGGGELGQAWYDDGRLMNKMNTFNDFIDLTEALLVRGYGDREYTYAMGGSAGGLLMGAVVNMRPDLWRGIIAQVPFVDVVTTMLDPTIPLTTGEYEEWGNPEQPDAYHYIKQYSPYDNVCAQAYPPMLITTGLHDSQVQYWEPAKWVAKLRELKTDDNLLLLQTDMDAGHGGKSGRFKGQEELALEYAFLIGLAQGTLPGAQQ